MARGKGKATHNPRQDALDAALESSSLDGSEWTEKQRLFALSYIRHHNSAKAVREAGYNCAWHNAGKLGYELQQVPHIAAFLEQNRLEQRQRLQVSADRVQEEWSRVAFFNLSRILDIQEDGTAKLNLLNADASDLAALAGIEIEERRIEGGDDDTPAEVVRTIKIKPHNKLGALTDLAKYLKMIGGDINVQLGADLADELAAAKARIRQERENAVLQAQDTGADEASGREDGGPGV